MRHSFQDLLGPHPFLSPSLPLSLQITNGISFVFSLTGTSFVIRRLGLYRSLVAFPILCMAAIAVAVMVPDLWVRREGWRRVYVSRDSQLIFDLPSIPPSLPPQVVFASLMFLKALSYSLNNPCKEMLYQPTSTGIKFKSKSWIDIFGQRGAKAAGSVVTNALSDSVRSLVLYGGKHGGGTEGGCFVLPTYLYGNQV